MILPAGALAVSMRNRPAASSACVDSDDDIPLSKLVHKRPAASSAQPGIERVESNLSTNKGSNAGTASAHEAHANPGAASLGLWACAHGCWLVGPWQDPSMGAGNHYCSLVFSTCYWNCCLAFSFDLTADASKGRRELFFA